MAYCTIDDLKKLIPEAKLIRLTDDEGVGAVDTDRAQEAIDSAAEEMDTYMGGKFALPISGTAPPILGKINTDIAIYNLYSRVKETVPDTRAERYKNAVGLLKEIAKGNISIGLQPIPDAPDAGDYAGGNRVSARTKIFDAETMDKY